MSPVIPKLFSTVIKKPVKRYYRTTGVPALDQLIYGWPRRGLALIYGSQKAGKTTLALQAAVTTALEEGKVLMLDTESVGIGELRLHSLAQAMGVKEELIPRVLSNITVYQAGELSEQHRIILDEWDSRAESPFNSASTKW